MAHLVAASPPSTRRDPNSVPSRVLAALREDGGSLRPVEVAKRLDITTQRAANALKILTDSGEAVRVRSETMRNGPGASVYKAASWE